MSDEPESIEGESGSEAEPTREVESASRDDEVADVETRLETLKTENERLREAVSAAHQRRYRLTAIGFAVVGSLALVGAALFPDERTVLVALGGTGLFGTVLTYFLTAERFVSASVGERVYGALADNEAAIVDDLALQGEPTIVPTEQRAVPAALFVSRTPGSVPPDAADLSAPFVTGDQPGLLLTPTGVGLYRDLLDSATTLPETPVGIATTVGDALVEQFELVDAVEVDAEAERVTMAVDGSAYGPVDRFDHPVVSVVATALAVEHQRPVTFSVTEADRADWLVTCRFESTTHG